MAEQRIVEKIRKLLALGRQEGPEGETARRMAEDLRARYGVTEKELEEVEAPIVVAADGSPEWKCKIGRTLCVRFDAPGARTVERGGRLTSVECDVSTEGKIVQSEMNILMLATRRYATRRDLLDGFSDGLALELGRRVLGKRGPSKRKKGTVLPDPAISNGPSPPIPFIPGSNRNVLDYELGLRMGAEAARRIELRYPRKP